MGTRDPGPGTMFRGRVNEEEVIVASDRNDQSDRKEQSVRNEQNEMSRREFASRVGAAAAGVVVGSELFGSSGFAAGAPSVNRPVRGANDRRVLAQLRAAGHS